VGQVLRRVKVILRWLAVAPAWLLAGVLVNIVFGVASCQYDPELYRDLEKDTAGFGGHYILGPSLVVARSIACGWVGMMAVALVAPAGKREATFVAASVLATLGVLLLVFITLRWNAGTVPTETLLRFILDLVPCCIAGFLLAAKVPHASSDVEIKQGDWLS
jgi:hypothetical protein